MMQNGKNQTKLMRAANYREVIQLQDLIMLTDIYSLPQLVTLLARSELNQAEVEYQILEQIAH